MAENEGTDLLSSRKKERKPEGKEEEGDRVGVYKSEKKVTFA